jgi:hypothetical protein
MSPNVEILGSHAHLRVHAMTELMEQRAFFSSAW